MEMTYAALAKSLGITLRSSSSSTSTASSAGKEHATASSPNPTSASAPISPSKLQTSSPDLLITTKEGKKKPEESETEKEKGVKEEASSIASPIFPRLSRYPETKVVDNGKRADAGDAESDIASSRGSSPSLAPASALERSSQEENSTEAAESQSTNPSSVSQGMDVYVGSNTGADVISAFSAPLTIADKDMTDEQLHQAKVLVLDLLGWGVPPEYLLQRGVSHALLYTVFTDLRLRLPESIIADCVRLVSAQS